MNHIKEYVDGIITVSDYELMAAFLVLVEKHKLVAENYNRTRSKCNKYKENISIYKIKYMERNDRGTSC